MDLPPEFHFSQNRLQDLAECARRFHLRHVQRLPWPAPAAEAEVEQRLRAGSRFHRAVQQFLLGVPAERIAAAWPDTDLPRWWRQFLATAPALWGGAERPRAGRFRAEVELLAPLGARRLLAKYDLVLVTPEGGLVIVDWKTAGRRPTRAALAERLQSRVYPYVLALAGGELTGGRPPAPERIELVYWFAEAPEALERFPYSTAQFHHDAAVLAGLIAEAERLDPAADLRTPQVERCRFCEYRSLCARQTSAGAGAEPAAPDEEPERPAASPAADDL